MKWILFTVLTCFLFTSCSKSDQKVDNEKEFSFGNPLSTNRALTPGEKRVASDLCRLVRDKRENFEILEDNRWEITFDGEEVGCGNLRLPKTTFVARLRVPTRGPVYLDSKTRRYISEIVTDQEGFLSYYCEDLLNGDNTTIIKDTGGKKVQLKVTGSGSYFVAEAAWYYPNDQGVYQSYLLDKVAFHTQSSTRNSRYFGMAKERVQYRPCDDGSIRSVKQTLR